jgi:hypothetical protein
MSKQAGPEAAVSQIWMPGADLADALVRMILGEHPA